MTARDPNLRYLASLFELAIRQLQRGAVFYAGYDLGSAARVLAELPDGPVHDRANLIFRFLVRWAERVEAVRNLRLGELDDASEAELSAQANTLAIETFAFDARGREVRR